MSGLARSLAISLQESNSITVHWTSFYHCAASSWINGTMEGVKYLHVIIGLKQYFSESISQKSQCFELFSPISLAALFSWMIHCEITFLFVLYKGTFLFNFHHLWKYAAPSKKRRKICCHNFFQTETEEELQYLKGDIWNTRLSKCQKRILVTCSSTFTLPILKKPKTTENIF